MVLQEVCKLIQLPFHTHGRQNCSNDVHAVCHLVNHSPIIFVNLIQSTGYKSLNLFGQLLFIIEKPVYLYGCKLTKASGNYKHAGGFMKFRFYIFSIPDSEGLQYVACHETVCRKSI